MFTTFTISAPIALVVLPTSYSASGLSCTTRSAVPARKGHVFMGQDSSPPSGEPDGGDRL